MSDQLLTMQEMSARTGLAISTLYQLRGRQEGPACFRLQGRREDHPKGKVMQSATVTVGSTATRLVGNGSAWLRPQWSLRC